uniref:Uncharacterized protein n=1 Tax=Romanomermis culicivorax TaxID=13658 RepID=A0A915HNE6_ROMCU
MPAYMNALAGQVNTLAIICMVTKNVSLYMRKSVVNSMKIIDEDLIDFPAITICSQITDKRVPTCDFPGIGRFGQYLSLTLKLEAFPWTDSLQQEYAKYCPCPKRYKRRTTAEAFEDFQQKNYYESLSEYSPSIDDQFVHCQMHGKSLKCGDIFGGHLTDIGLCATFKMIHSEAASQFI